MDQIKWLFIISILIITVDSLYLSKLISRCDALSFMSETCQGAPTRRLSGVEDLGIVHDIHWMDKENISNIGKEIDSIPISIDESTHGLSGIKNLGLNNDTRDIVTVPALMGQKGIEKKIPTRILSNDLKCKNENNIIKRGRENHNGLLRKNKIRFLAQNALIRGGICRNRIKANVLHRRKTCIRWEAIKIFRLWLLNKLEKLSRVQILAKCKTIKMILEFKSKGSRNILIHRYLTGLYDRMCTMDDQKSIDINGEITKDAISSNRGTTDDLVESQDTQAIFLGRLYPSCNGLPIIVKHNEFQFIEPNKDLDWLGMPSTQSKAKNDEHSSQVLNVNFIHDYQYKHPNKLHSSVDNYVLSQSMDYLKNPISKKADTFSVEISPSPVDVLTPTPITNVTNWESVPDYAGSVTHSPLDETWLQTPAIEMPHNNQQIPLECDHNRNCATNSHTTKNPSPNEHSDIKQVLSTVDQHKEWLPHTHDTFQHKDKPTRDYQETFENTQSYNHPMNNSETLENRHKTTEPDHLYHDIKLNTDQYIKDRYYPPVVHHLPDETLESNMYNNFAQNMAYYYPTTGESDNIIDDNSDQYYRTYPPDAIPIEYNDFNWYHKHQPTEINPEIYHHSNNNYNNTNNYAFDHSQLVYSDIPGSYPYFPSTKQDSYKDYPQEYLMGIDHNTKVSKQNIISTALPIPNIERIKAMATLNHKTNMINRFGFDSVNDLLPWKPRSFDNLEAIVAKVKDHTNTKMESGPLSERLAGWNSFFVMPHDESGIPQDWDHLHTINGLDTGTNDHYYGSMPVNLLSLDQRGNALVPIHTNNEGRNTVNNYERNAADIRNKVHFESDYNTFGNSFGWKDNEEFADQDGLPYLDYTSENDSYDAQEFQSDMGDKFSFMMEDPNISSRETTVKVGREKYSFAMSEGLHGGQRRNLGLVPINPNSIVKKSGRIRRENKLNFDKQNKSGYLHDKMNDNVKYNSSIDKLDGESNTEKPQNHIFMRKPRLSVRNDNAITLPAAVYISDTNSKLHDKDIQQSEMETENTSSVGDTEKVAVGGTNLPRLLIRKRNANGIMHNPIDNNHAYVFAPRVRNKNIDKVIESDFDVVSFQQEKKEETGLTEFNFAKKNPYSDTIKRDDQVDLIQNHTLSTSNIPDNLHSPNDRGSDLSEWRLAKVFGHISDGNLQYSLVNNGAIEPQHAQVETKNESKFSPVGNILSSLKHNPTEWQTLKMHSPEYLFKKKLGGNATFPRMKTTKVKGIRGFSNVDNGQDGVGNNKRKHPMVGETEWQDPNRKTEWIENRMKTSNSVPVDLSESELTASLATSKYLNGREQSSYNEFGSTDLTSGSRSMSHIEAFNNSNVGFLPVEDDNFSQRFPDVHLNDGSKVDLALDTNMNRLAIAMDSGNNNHYQVRVLPKNDIPTDVDLDKAANEFNWVIEGSKSNMPGNSNLNELVVWHPDNPSLAEKTVDMRTGGSLKLLPQNIGKRFWKGKSNPKHQENDRMNDVEMQINTENMKRKILDAEVKHSGSVPLNMLLNQDSIDILTLNDREDDLVETQKYPNSIGWVTPENDSKLGFNDRKDHPDPSGESDKPVVLMKNSDNIDDVTMCQASHYGNTGEKEQYCYQPIAISSTNNRLDDATNSPWHMDSLAKNENEIREQSMPKSVMLHNQSEMEAKHNYDLFTGNGIVGYKSLNKPLLTILDRMEGNQLENNHHNKQGDHEPSNTDIAQAYINFHGPVSTEIELDQDMVDNYNNFSGRNVHNLDMYKPNKLKSGVLHNRAKGMGELAPQGVSNKVSKKKIMQSRFDSGLKHEDFIKKILGTNQEEDIKHNNSWVSYPWLRDAYLIALPKIDQLVKMKPWIQSWGSSEAHGSGLHKDRSSSHQLVTPGNNLISTYSDNKQNNQMNEKFDTVIVDELSTDEISHNIDSHTLKRDPTKNKDEYQNRYDDVTDDIVAVIRHNDSQPETSVSNITDHLAPKLIDHDETKLVNKGMGLATYVVLGTGSVGLMLLLVLLIICLNTKGNKPDKIIFGKPDDFKYEWDKPNYQVKMQSINQDNENMP